MAEYNNFEGCAIFSNKFSKYKSYICNIMVFQPLLSLIFGMYSLTVGLEICQKCDFKIQKYFYA